MILVSDGLDNCAPPAPCRARGVAQRGVELTISVVGFAVDERVRRQMRCIARVGGGTYVDAGDTDRCARELLAAFARAFRATSRRHAVPRARPSRGGAAPGQRLYQGELSPGEARVRGRGRAGPAAVRGRHAGRAARPAPAGRSASPCSTPRGEERRLRPGRPGTRDSTADRRRRAARRAGGRAADPGDYGVHCGIRRAGRDRPPDPARAAVEALEPDARPGAGPRAGPRAARGGARSPRRHRRPDATRPRARGRGGDAGAPCWRARRRRAAVGPEGRRRRRGRGGARCGAGGGGARAGARRRPRAQPDRAEPVSAAGPTTPRRCSSPARYRDTLLPGEYLYYAIPLEAGQRLHVRD